MNIAKLTTKHPTDEEAAEAAAENTLWENVEEAYEIEKAEQPDGGLEDYWKAWDAFQASIPPEDAARWQADHDAWEADKKATFEYIKNKVDKTRAAAIHANIATMFSCTAHFCQYCDYANCSYRRELIRLRNASQEIEVTLHGCIYP